MGRYPPKGPNLRYTNERAREMERSIAGFAKIVNDDLYDLLSWASEIQAERDRYKSALKEIANPTFRANERSVQCAQIALNQEKA